MRATSRRIRVHLRDLRSKALTEHTATAELKTSVGPAPVEPERAPL
ncbi:MAG: hypothetical protein AVDCRST_MAG40-781 [uncultured Gemmatimonadaceae bacterium]|uniref:Uncharacterized protein n=1 Tax=uncultured Gemmatimonadaceae bacterium TaxID=246130 RepID=A0A6J4KLG7_9BACT|nr:MAG: hypothetical protein AVDCRST_MAG40-781 [uncultured Gemmatimonadaceae bacterium]